MPGIVVQGSDESMWFVADRFHSRRRFDRIRVHLVQDEPVTASITAYRYGPSDWAIVGSFFIDTHLPERLAGN